MQPTDSQKTVSATLSVHTQLGLSIGLSLNRTAQSAVQYNQQLLQHNAAQLVCHKSLTLSLSHAICLSTTVVSSQSVSRSHSVWSSVCRSVCQSVCLSYHEHSITSSLSRALWMSLCHSNCLSISHTHCVARSVSQFSIAQSVILSYHKQSVARTLSLCLTNCLSVWNSLCLLLCHSRCCSTTHYDIGAYYTCRLSWIDTIGWRSTPSRRLPRSVRSWN